MTAGRNFVCLAHRLQKHLHITLCHFSWWHFDVGWSLPRFRKSNLLRRCFVSRVAIFICFFSHKVIAPHHKSHIWCLCSVDRISGCPFCYWRYEFSWIAINSLFWTSWIIFRCPNYLRGFRMPLYWWYFSIFDTYHITNVVDERARDFYLIFAFSHFTRVVQPWRFHCHWISLLYFVRCSRPTVSVFYLLSVGHLLHRFILLSNMLLHFLEVSCQLLALR